MPVFNAANVELSIDGVLSQTYKDLELIGNSQELSDYSDPGDFRVSAGVSVQWISPMGPLTFSLGRALKEVEGDETQVFSFNIGTTF